MRRSKKKRESIHNREISKAQFKKHLKEYIQEIHKNIRFEKLNVLENIMKSHMCYIFHMFQFEYKEKFFFKI